MLFNFKCSGQCCRWLESQGRVFFFSSSSSSASCFYSFPLPSDASPGSLILPALAAVVTYPEHGEQEQLCWAEEVAVFPGSSSREGCPGGLPSC